MNEGHATTRKSLKRPTKPPILTRRSTGQRSAGSGGASDITPRASPVRADQPVDSLDMAASFLQHCAFCEKQIMHPSNNMLYCSQACRRKDTNKPMSLPEATSMTPPPVAAPSSPIAILSASTPTGASYMDYPSIRIPADQHNAKSDLDPTEWKPKGKRDFRNSEAFRYLSQFHRTSVAGLDENERVNTNRPYMHRSYASMSSMTTTPSLASTPTTATSSLSVEYDFNTRALPPRHNPIYSSSAGTTKDIGLVTPHIAPVVVGSPVLGVENWEKMPVSKRTGVEKDGLLSMSMGK